MPEAPGQDPPPLASQLRWLIGIRLVVITSIGLIAHNPVGWSVAGLGGLVSLYCWSCYRRLER